jgi:ATP-dependent Lhr-like helicase
MSIGTIVSDAQMQVKYMSGGRIGSVEESFIGRLKPGDHFLFSGRILELVRVHEMTAYVKRAAPAAAARSAAGAAPRCRSVRAGARGAGRAAPGLEGSLRGPEMQALRPLLEIQARWSALPSSEVLVIESMKSREGFTCSSIPSPGARCTPGLASLLAFRVGRMLPSTFSMAVNDYGFELLSPEPVDWARMFAGATGAGSACSIPAACWKTCWTA